MIGINENLFSSSAASSWDDALATWSPLIVNTALVALLLEAASADVPFDVRMAALTRVGTVFNRMNLGVAATAMAELIPLLASAISADLDGRPAIPLDPDFAPRTTGLLRAWTSPPDTTPSAHKPSLASFSRADKGTELRAALKSGNIKEALRLYGQGDLSTKAFLPLYPDALDSARTVASASTASAFYGLRLAPPQLASPVQKQFLDRRSTGAIPASRQLGASTQHEDTRPTLVSELGTLASGLAKADKSWSTERDALFAKTHYIEELLASLPPHTLTELMDWATVAQSVPDFTIQSATVALVCRAEVLKTATASEPEPRWAPTNTVPTAVFAALLAEISASSRTALATKYLERRNAAFAAAGMPLKTRLPANYDGERQIFSSEEIKEIKKGIADVKATKAAKDSADLARASNSLAKSAASLIKAAAKDRRSDANNPRGRNNPSDANAATKVPEVGKNPFLPSSTAVGDKLPATNPKPDSKFKGKGKSNGSNPKIPGSGANRA